MNLSIILSFCMVDRLVVSACGQLDSAKIPHLTSSFEIGLLFAFITLDIALKVVFLFIYEVDIRSNGFEVYQQEDKQSSVVMVGLCLSMLNPTRC